MNQKLMEKQLASLFQVSSLLEGTSCYNAGAVTVLENTLRRKKETKVKIVCRKCGKVFIPRPRDVLRRGFHHTCKEVVQNV